jgi:hypothetical protein
VKLKRAAEYHLPQELLARASLRGNEHAWPVDDIPHVIEAARQTRLINIGGQLQFRIPAGGTCECYWVDVDTYRSVSKHLPWQERVERTAAAALQQFPRLPSEFDFVAEGRRGFGQQLEEFERQGHDPKEAMCFVWYVLDQAGDQEP